MHNSNNRANAGHHNGINRMPRRISAQTTAGFTLVELITVIVILGILSVVVIPRFIDRGSVTPSSAQAQVIATARHAQQLGMNQGGGVTMAIDAGNKRLTITHTGSPVVINLPKDISISGPDITYDALGNINTSQTIQINGGQREICISAAGYAYDC